MVRALAEKQRAIHRGGSWGGIRENADRRALRNQGRDGSAKFDVKKAADVEVFQWAGLAWRCGYIDWSGCRGGVSQGPWANC